MKLSIRKRLTFSFALIFIALIVLFSGVIYSLMSHSLERKLREDSEHDMQLLLHDFKTKPFEIALPEMEEETEEMRVLIQVVDGQGKVLHRTKGIKEWDWPVDKDDLGNARQKPLWSETEINGISHLVLTQSFTTSGDSPYFIQVANSRELIKLIQDQLIFCINIGTPLILIVVVISGGFFSKKALQPVVRISDRAQTITSDNLYERLAYDGPQDELFKLTETLNDLLDRIEQSVNQMKQFVADASHELRIPLTGLRGTVEVALRQDRSKEVYKQTLEILQTEFERLSELVWDLLSLARIDAGEVELEPTEVEIEPFLQNVLAETETLNPDKQVNIRLENTPKGKAKFDEAQIHQLLINLIENAIHYNKPGGDIRLSAALNDGKFVVSVKDTGIGISPEDQAKIFDRFYRVDKARSREAGGTGLGLAIARVIAEAHNGTLTVRSVIDEGSEFTLTLPSS